MEENSSNEYYKSIIEEFCKQNTKTKKEGSYLLKPEVYGKDLFKLNPSELGELVIELGGTSSAMYFKQNYVWISKLFDWFVSEGYLEVNKYKTLSGLSYNNLLFKMAQRSTVTVIYDYELKKYTDISPYNKELHAVIIGLLYDGVTSLKELTSLRWEHIDLDEGIIKINNREIILSEFSLKSLKKYRDVDEYEVENSHGFSYRTEYISHKDYLIKVIKARYDPDFTDEKYIQRRAAGCGKLLKRIGISYFDVTKSGALNALRRELADYSDLDFCKMFFKEESKRTTYKEAFHVNNVLKIYGMGNPTDLVDSLIPFVVKSKYYR